jgi:hypothetical protein
MALLVETSDSSGSRHMNVELVEVIDASETIPLTTWIPAGLNQVIRSYMSVVEPATDSDMMALAQTTADAIMSIDSDPSLQVALKLGNPLAYDGILAVIPVKTAAMVEWVGRTWLAINAARTAELAED